MHWGGLGARTSRSQNSIATGIHTYGACTVGIQVVTWYAALPSMNASATPIAPTGLTPSWRPRP